TAPSPRRCRARARAPRPPRTAARALTTAWRIARPVKARPSRGTTPRELLPAPASDCRTRAGLHRHPPPPVRDLHTAPRRAPQPAPSAVPAATTASSATSTCVTPPTVSGTKRARPNARTPPTAKLRRAAACGRPASAYIRACGACPCRPPTSPTPDLAVPAAGGQGRASRLPVRWHRRWIAGWPGQCRIRAPVLRRACATPACRAFLAETPYIDRQYIDDLASLGLADSR